MSWDPAVTDRSSAESAVCRSCEPVTMADKNTEIRVAVVSSRTAVVPACWSLIPHRHWWLYGSSQSDSRILVSGRCMPPTLWPDHLPAAYVLDLRDKFPRAGGDVLSAENALVGREWRERALELEARCSKLERMYEWDKLGTCSDGELHEETAGKYFYRASGRDTWNWARDA